jgi:hypothetical protein
MKITRCRTTALVATLALLAGCASPRYDPDKHPARMAAAWGGLPSPAPLTDKILPVPPAVLDYVNRDNVANGFPERPTAAAVDDGFKKDVRDAISGLPQGLQARISSRLYGIYLVNDLGGTAFTDMVFDANRKAVGTFMLLDRGMLERKANDWADWKESTPFKPESGWAIHLRLENPRHDTRSAAIQYILLHEFGHVLASAGGIHPAWNKGPKQDPPSSYPFARLSWTVDPKGRYASVFEKDFPERGTIKYYFGDPAKKPALSSAPAIYGKLHATNFVTLYGATNPYDDFAEAFASYVHTVTLKKPWRLVVEHDGKPAASYGSCWAEERCREKRKVLEGLLRR